jgi:hypothetical protein
LLSATAHRFALGGPDIPIWDNINPAVLVRVRAYREIKNQNQLTRDE